MGCNSSRSASNPSTNINDRKRHQEHSFHENLVRQRTGHGRRRFDQPYEVLEEIGCGTLCNIYKIRKRQQPVGVPVRRLTPGNSWKQLHQGFMQTGKSIPQNTREGLFALKVIHLSLVPEDRIEQLKNEVEILKMLDHKNIIRAYETFSFKESKTLEIVMELCTGGNLYARMPYKESNAANVLKQLLGAVSFIHEREIIHRDIKIENVMFENEHPEACIRVIDFGLSKKYSIDNPVLTERVGTLYAMSPETMQGRYAAKSDLWSIGVCLFMMLSNGEKPFEGKTAKQLVKRVLKGDVHFEGHVWADISTEAQDFIKKMLRVDPTARVTAHEAMYDPWFKSHAIAATQLSRHTPKPELIENVLESLIQFAGTGEFRKLALNVIAKKATPEEIFELRNVFDEFDTLNTGTITLVEFKAALIRFNYSDEHIEKIFRKVDVNKTNVINYTEFLAATLETQITIEDDRLAECFMEFDTDDSGYISRDNLRGLLGKHSSEAFIDLLMREADAEDGRITYEQFRKVVSKGHRQAGIKLYNESERLPGMLWKGCDEDITADATCQC